MERELDRARTALTLQIVYAGMVTFVVFSSVIALLLLAPSAPALTGVLVGYLALTVALPPLTYVLVYRALRKERVSRARGAALPLGVLSLPAGGVISGVLLLLVWNELRESRQSSPMSSREMTRR